MPAAATDAIGVPPAGKSSSVTNDQVQSTAGNKRPSDEAATPTSKKAKLNGDQQEAYEGLCAMLQEAKVKMANLEPMAFALAKFDYDADLLSDMDGSAIRDLHCDELSKGNLEKIVVYNNKRKRAE